MVVQHNLTAMNSNRMLGITQGTLSKSTEKLASGYKVNRAADDAAGLSISEKMRKQIRGLTQASSNAQDGISAVQTAEGALTEVHDMLQRMNELAVKASNGTMSENDRQTVQDEVNQLLTEIDRVAETTKFNETYLLKGGDGTANVTLNAQDAGLVGTWYKKDGSTADATANTDTEQDEVVFQISLTAGQKINIGGKEYTVDFSNDTTDVTAEGKVGGKGVAALVKAELGKANGIGNDKSGYGTADTKGTAAKDSTTLQFTIKKSIAQTNKELSFSLHVGADADMTNKISVGIKTMNTAGLGIKGLNVKDDSGAKATYAVDAIADAVARVSKQRSELGAVQNRLEHTIKNLDNIVENTTSAESLIRDTDMASEMVKYSNTNILSQAGQSMLAQSNQANQGILSLLR